MDSKQQTANSKQAKTDNQTKKCEPEMRESPSARGAPRAVRDFQ
jgi:hypothetical protein